MAAPPAPPGFLSSLHTLADGLVGGLKKRLELLAVELHEEKLRLIQTLFWLGAAFFAASLTVVFASLALVCLYWETARLAVLGGLAGFFAFALLAVVLAFRRHLSRSSPPFGASLDELRKDRACIRTAN